MTATIVEADLENPGHQKAITALLKYVGKAICFLGFSTFYARPLINIHDFTVKKDCRDRGIGKQLISTIERKAMLLDCCKLTLEVQEMNTSALELYGKCGF